MSAILCALACPQIDSSRGDGGCKCIKEDAGDGVHLIEKRMRAGLIIDDKGELNKVGVFTIALSEIRFHVTLAGH